MRAVSHRAGRGSLVLATIVLAVFATWLATVGSTTSSAATSSAKAAAALRQVNAQLKKFEAIPTFKPPGPVFSAAKAVKGKTVFIIPENDQNGFVQVVQQGLQQAAKVAGERIIIYPNQGQLSQWQQGMQQAIARKVNEIDLFGAPNPAQLGPQIAAAHRAGIKVIVTRWYGFTQKPAPGIDALVDAPYAAAARLEAGWVISQTHAKANVLILESSDFTPSLEILPALRSEFKKFCPNCQLTVRNVVSTAWPTQLQPTVQQALIKNPKINYIIPMYDSMSQFVVPGITAAHATSRVKGIATYNGTPAILNMLAQKRGVTMDVGEAENWLGWAIVDQELRVLGGLTPVKSENTPLRVWFSGNIKEAGTPPKATLGYGNSYISGYKKLWKIGK